MKDILIGLVIVVLVCLVLGIAGIKGYDLGRDKTRKQAIENNCMYHEPKTGELVWGSIK